MYIGLTNLTVHAKNGICYCQKAGTVAGGGGNGLLSNLTSSSTVIIYHVLNGHVFHNWPNKRSSAEPGQANTTEYDFNQIQWPLFSGQKKEEKV